MEMKFVFYDMIEKVFNSEFEEINEILINKRKELGNDIDVDKDISNILVTIKDNEENQKVKDILSNIEEKYDKKISEYNKEMYKKGFIDGVNLIMNCIKS
mgnify:CR=1 FL=1